MEARVDAPSFVAPIVTTATTEVVVAVKVIPTAKVGITAKDSMPPTSMSSPVEDLALQSPTGREEGEKKNKVGSPNTHTHQNDESAEHPSSGQSQGQSSPTNIKSPPEGIPLRPIVKNLKEKIHHLKKKLRKTKDELQRSRKNASKVTVKVTRLRKLHMKESVSFSIRKDNFEKELAELRNGSSKKSSSSTRGEFVMIF
ncbi:hypothetical protein COCNU_scaffold000210G000030 [Cocos nucifera]|nr:hypothetical protein [Cocos nucifera]